MSDANVWEQASAYQRGLTAQLVRDVTREVERFKGWRLERVTLNGVWVARGPTPGSRVRKEVRAPTAKGLVAAVREANGAPPAPPQGAQGVLL